MTAETILDDAGYDFGNLTDESVSEVPPPAKKAGTSRSAGVSGSAPRRGRPRKTARLDDLKSKLSDELYKVGGMTGLMLPVTGYYVCAESQAFCEAVVELADGHPGLLNALEQIAKLEPGLVVGRTALGIGAAVAVDRRKATPDSFIMAFLGVKAAYDAIQAKMPPTPGGMSGASNYQPPPATFIPAVPV